MPILSVQHSTDTVPELGPLADSTAFHDPIGIAGEPTARLLDWLYRMHRIRRTEDVIGELVRSGEVRCPCHLAIGQEAAAVGVASTLTPRDRAFGAHRSHGHYLAMGGSLDALLAEVLGRDSGCSRGMGGSMHLTAPEVGLLGTVPIVGATIPMAVGAALAAKLEGTDAIGVAYFGDGATEEGVFHESMNLAASQRIPALFVCEHNLFSSHLHISLRQPTTSVARYAVAHHVPAWTVDGNDVVAVASAAAAAVSGIRGSGGPAFLELVTYRWRGHVGPNDDLDVGVRRKDDLVQWRGRDPIARLARALETERDISRAALDAMVASIDAELADSLARARSAPLPPSDLLSHILHVGAA